MSSFLLIELAGFIFVCVKSKSLSQLAVGAIVLSSALSVNQITQEIGIVSYQDIALAIAFALCTYVILRKNVSIPKKYIFAIALLLVLGVGRLWVQLVFPLDDLIIGDIVLWDPYYQGAISKMPITISQHSWIMVVRLFLSIVILFCFCYCLDRSERSKVLEGVLVLTKIHIAIMALEFVLKNFLHGETLFGLFITGIYGEDYGLFSTGRGSLSDLQGLASEPAHAATALIFFLVLMIAKRRILRMPSRHDLAWMVASVALLMLSMAFTSLYGLAVIGVLLLVTRSASSVIQTRFQVKRAGALLIGLACIFGLAWFLTSDLSIYYLNKLKNVIDGLALLPSGSVDVLRSATTSDQGLARLLSMYEACVEFLMHPLFGLGIGVMNVHSGLFSALASFGLVGVTLWSFVVFGCAKESTATRADVARAAVFLAILIAALMDDGVMYSLGIFLIVYSMQAPPVARSGNFHLLS